MQWDKLQWARQQWARQQWADDNSGPMTTARTVLFCSALAVLLAATWILSGALVEHNDAQTVAAGRSLFSCLGLLLIALRSRGALKRSVQLMVRRPVPLLISGLLGVAVYALFSVFAISTVGTSATNLVIAMAPGLSLVFGVLLFKQHPGWLAVLAVVSAVIGAAIYVLGSFQGPAADGSARVAGLVAAVIAVCSIAFYGQHYARIARGYPPSDLLLGIFLFGTVLLFLLMAVTGSLSGFLRVAPLDWLWFLILGVVVYVPVYLIQHRLIHEKGAVFTATVSLAVPFLVRAADVVWFGKPWPNLAETLGLLLCVAGIAVVVRNGTKKGAALLPEKTGAG